MLTGLSLAAQTTKEWVELKAEGSHRDHDFVMSLYPGNDCRLSWLDLHSSIGGLVDGFSKMCEARLSFILMVNIPKKGRTSRVRAHPVNCVLPSLCP